ncbi:MAG: hypothetical protein Q8O88_00925 [bacterium]|nr:hypothetical protein [bacterium]
MTTNQNETIVVPAKDLINKPTLDEEMKMVIGMAIEEMAELKNKISELEKRMEEMENEKRK